MVPLRLCRACSTEKPLADFSVDCRTGKPVARCKPCCSAASQVSQKKNPEFKAKSRASSARYNKSYAGTMWRKAHRAKPEVRERINASLRKWRGSPNGQAKMAAIKDRDRASGRLRARSAATLAFKSDRLEKTP